MNRAFNPIIFFHKDEDNPDQGVWVRIASYESGATITLFKRQPTTETPQWQGMATVDIDACYDNQAKVRIWDETKDPERDDPKEIPLIENIDRWKPLKVS
jgi:hypothetical protein